MPELFIKIRILDIIDILLVAFLMYQVYLLIRGTVAMNIFIGIISVYLIWLIVKALNMQLLGSILGQVIGVGVIALIIVFQQEIRRFLIFIGNQYFSNQKFSLENLFSMDVPTKAGVKIKSIVKACITMVDTRTGALIVLARKSNMKIYAETGDILNAQTSSRLLISIFNKESPLHDGAVILKGEKVYAARCILPVTENPNIPPALGLRHRAALGMSEQTDSLVIVISEQTGTISIADNGHLELDLDSKELMQRLEEEFG